MNEDKFNFVGSVLFMRNTVKIPALLLAMLVFVSTTGISVFEHICTTSQSTEYSFFSKPVCEMEKPIPPCCAKKVPLTKPKKGCCEHKEFFSKLNVEGFTAKQVQLKPLEKLFTAHFILHPSSLFGSHTDLLSFRLPPPDNLYRIKARLQPSPVSLQVFRC